jgi:hypothetical protein
MDFSELKSRVHRAIDVLYARDAKLFTVDASEWALAHRLAIYLEHEISGWNVDCEYNRQGNGRDPKTNELEEKVRPDITIHHRGFLEPEHNLLVIELKKREEEFDLKKTREYTDKPTGKRLFQYQYGLALSFLPKLETHWFQNGQEKT